MNKTYEQARLTRDPRFDGKFFTAVKTTKIFCRSICPANSPLEKNVEYYELAQQAMHAGYRPCLRCRPDSAPQSYAWQGVNTTVTRATRLLRQHHTLHIEDIAEKLGISSRYFRQLFQQHIGMSPKQYQQFDKVLFAKKLLHQGQLSIESVAQASGFSSARRMQDNVKKMTGLTPKEIRQDRLEQSRNINMKIAFRPPFNWPHMRDFLSLRAIKGVEEVTENSYARSFVLDKYKGWFKASFPTGKHCLELEIDIPNTALLINILRNIERIFDVDADTALIETQLNQCGIEESALTQGLRLPGVWDTFEAGCRAILGQQISVKAAIALLSSLTNELGIKEKGKTFFPSAQAVANSDLSFLKIPQSRKHTLRLFAEHTLAFKEGTIDDWIDVKGIGPWTIAYAKLRGLSLPDVWLDSDLVIKKQLKLHSLDTELARPWRSYLTFQLWNMA